MLRKLNIALGIFAICGALFVGGVYVYTHHTSIENKKVIKELGGM